jgi:hypothetical protein
VVCRAVEHGAVLLHTEDEVYFGLNAVGLQIWELLPVCEDVDALCAALAGRYPDVAPERLRADVLELLDELRLGKLVVEGG